MRIKNKMEQDLICAKIDARNKLSFGIGLENACEQKKSSCTKDYAKQCEIWKLTKLNEILKT